MVPEPPSVPKLLIATEFAFNLPFTSNVPALTVAVLQRLLLPARTTTPSPSAVNDPPLPRETVFEKVITVLVSVVVATFPAVHSNATSAPKTVLEKFMRAFGLTARICEALAIVIGPAQV